MKLAKKIKDIKFEKVNVYGEMMEVSEPIVMDLLLVGMLVKFVGKMVSFNLMIGSQSI